jgi:hypothetical protein
LGFANGHGSHRMCHYMQPLPIRTPELSERARVSLVVGELPLKLTAKFLIAYETAHEKKPPPDSRSR